MIFCIISVVAACAYTQGKILGYDGERISYSIYFPDYDRDYKASESKETIDVHFVIFWEYHNGNKTQEECSTSIEMFTNTQVEFRYPLERNTMQITKATINLYIEGKSADTYIVNFIRDGL
jgi:hypothetical protein